MAEKLISNPGQFGSIGASWGTPSFDNAMTTENADLINGTGQTLYVGDIVCLDATGTQAVLAGAAGDNTVIGCVNDPRHQATESPLLTSGATSLNSIGYPAIGGSFLPSQDTNTSVQTIGYTNGSQNATSSLVSTNNPMYVGAYVYPPTSAYSSAANTQIFQVASNGGSSGAWTAVLNVVVGPVGGPNNFQGTTGSYSSTVGDSPQSIGPGWRNQIGWTASSTFAVNAIVPVTIRGYGRVNINALSTIVARDLVTATSASVIGTRVANGAGTAAQIGNFIAIALEAYAARDTSLTSLGITGHDSIRAIIGKF